MNITKLLFAALAALLLTACSGDGLTSSLGCNETTNINHIFLNGEKLDFKPTKVFANKYNDISYRVIMINYDFSDYSEFGKLKEGQTKVVFMLSNPGEDGFEEGSYDPLAKTNKASFNVTVGENNYHYATRSNGEGYGSAEITYITDKGVCGSAKLKSMDDHELDFTFSAENIKL